MNHVQAISRVVIMEKQGKLIKRWFKFSCKCYMHMYIYILYTFMLMLARFSTALGFKKYKCMKMELKNEHSTST